MIIILSFVGDRNQILLSLCCFEIGRGEHCPLFLFIQLYSCELESHLQEAILAQQASTSGIAVENHLIPTPKVFTVDCGYYDAVYPVQPAPSINQLIKVQASLSLGNEEPEYDIDSGDEAWLADRGGHVAESDFEKMMELLENASSGLQICQPNEAHILLKDFETDLVDDVYDYWLQKRKDAAASRKIASLIPRVKTDARRDASSSDMAYVAFRRRLERMQTRKNRKNDEDSYEKILKLGHDLSRAVALFDMIRRREHVKQAIVDLDEKICKTRWNMSDFDSVIYNDILTQIKLERNMATSPIEDSQDEMLITMSPSKIKGQKRKRHSKNSLSVSDNDLVTRSWLRRNAELWNKPAIAANVLNFGTSPSTTPSCDVERNAEAALDGRYTFKRRRGCIYRSSLFSHSAEVPKICPAERFFRTFMPSEQGTRCIGYARRRMGRGGRIIFDRVLLSEPSTSQSAPDPPFTPVIDTTKSYQCRLITDNDRKHESLSDSEDNEWDENDEQQYREREELYAKRIFGMLGADSTQRRASGRDGTFRGSGEQVVVLGEDTTSIPVAGQNISTNGVQETEHLRILNLQQNGPPLNVHVRSVSDCGSQPVLLTASVAGKVEKVTPLPTSINYQLKRVSDHSSSKASLLSKSNESSVFHTHLPPPLHPSLEVIATGEQTVRPLRTFEYITSPNVLAPSQTLSLGVLAPSQALGSGVLTSSQTLSSCVLASSHAPSSGMLVSSQALNSGVLAQSQTLSSCVMTSSQKLGSGVMASPQTLILTTSQPARHDRVERHVIPLPSQEYFIGGQSVRPKRGGRRRPMTANVAQLTSSFSRSETNQQRYSVFGFNGDVTQATSCVDTKRLELAIKGSGARIKPPPIIAPSLLHPCPSETRTLRDLLLGTGLTNMKAALNKPASAKTSSTPHHVPAVNDKHRYTQYTNIGNCRISSFNTYQSFPATEGVPPPVPHVVAPTVAPKPSFRNYFAATEPKSQAPMAVISRASLNGTQVDSRRWLFQSMVDIGTNGIGNEREVEQAAHQTKCRVNSSSSMLSVTVGTEISLGGSVSSRSGKGYLAATTTTTTPDTATVTSASTESSFPQQVVKKEDPLSSATTSSHLDITACHGVISYAIN
ncbi:unnamed protein product [Thelazia callipaeda]|uniref:Enhancer of polycomb-like protein n=1 Tax=Thelazia callipaeda TaxID=103827 RepID=A0A3P7KLU8_THECL|nr:unnamed protein product [Thelazia callipaeda]